MKLKKVDDYLKGNQRRKEIRDYFSQHGISETEKHYGLTRSRIYQIVDEYKRYENVIKKREMEGLPVCILNPLKRYGFTSTKELRKYCKQNGVDGLTKIHCIGKERAEFIMEYLEIMEVKS